MAEAAEDSDATVLDEDDAQRAAQVQSGGGSAAGQRQSRGKRRKQKQRENLRRNLETWAKRTAEKAAAAELTEEEGEAKRVLAYEAKKEAADARLRIASLRSAKK